MTDKNILNSGCYYSVVDADGQTIGSYGDHADAVRVASGIVGSRIVETAPDGLTIVDLSCGSFEYGFLSAFEGWTVRYNGAPFQLTSADRGVVTLQPWDNETDEPNADAAPIVVDLRDGSNGNWNLLERR